MITTVSAANIDDKGITKGITDSSPIIVVDGMAEKCKITCKIWLSLPLY